MKICILGGGNGAYAAAGHLGSEGHEIRLFSSFPEELTPIKENNAIKLKGCLGEIKVEDIQIKNNIFEAASGADIVMPVVPAIAHTHYAGLLASVLEDDQVLLLNPGHTGGALHVMHKLNELNCSANIKLAETNTLTYIARKTKGNEVNIFKVASHIFLSALPSIDTENVYSIIKTIYPGIQPAENVLETSLTNLNAILHPPVMLLNATRIEQGEAFYFYSEGTTPAVGKTMEKLDEERVNILKQANLKPTSFLEHFYKGGYTTKSAYKSGSYTKAVKESPPNQKIEAPNSLAHRFLEEDICRGLVPISEIGQLFGVETKITDFLIYISGIVNNKNYRVEGLKINELGLDNFSSKEVLNYVNKGL